MTAKCWGIVPAAGIGARIGGEVPKQYAKVDGVCILDYSIRALLACRAMQTIVVAVAAQDQWWNDTNAARDARVQTCMGGEHRFASVANALNHMDSVAEVADDDWIAVHDGVRPCLVSKDIEYLLNEIAAEAAGGILAVPIDDTVKRVDGGYVCETLERNHLIRAATPQVFRYHVLRQAFEQAARDNLTPPDEAAAVEHAGYKVKAVFCDSNNIKVTRPQDLSHVAPILKQSSGSGV